MDDISYSDMKMYPYSHIFPNNSNKDNNSNKNNQKTNPSSSIINYGNNDKDTNFS